jgi:UDP-N-acetyl-D-glucosamine dehydrogenase
VILTLRRIVKSGLFFSHKTIFSFFRNVDFIAICVPTPLNDYKEPDISYVESSAREKQNI